MLTPPDVAHASIIAALRQAYDLPVAALEFLPLGVDANAAVYRVEAGAPYFLKLRRGPFDEVAVTLPRRLRDQGVRAIIAPLPTHTSNLWTAIGEFKAVLYPFVAGEDGYTRPLTDAQWHTLGAALQRIHAATLPPDILDRIPQETYVTRWCAAVTDLVTQTDDLPQADAVAGEAAAFLREQRAILLDLATRAADLARRLRDRPPPTVVCHADLHAGNVLLDAAGNLYIVDWDAPIRAPKERDLMFPGGFQFGRARAPAEEERLFYAGYGPVEVDATALAYYRYIRILEDIVLFAEDIFQARVSDEDRAQSLHYLKANFGPGATIDVAYQGDRT